MPRFFGNQTGWRRFIYSPEGAEVQKNVDGCGNLKTASFRHSRVASAMNRECWQLMDWRQSFSGQKRKKLRYIEEARKP